MQMSVGETLGDAWRLYTRFFVRLVLIAAVVFFVLGLVNAGLAQLTDDGGFTAWVVGAVGLISGFVGFFWVQGALVEATADMRDGTPDLGVGQVYGRVAPVLGTLIIAGVLAAIGIALGLALILPGLFLLTIWSMLAPVIVLEKLPAGQAFSRSRQLVRGNGLPVLGLALLLLIALIVVTRVISSVFQSVLGDFLGVWLGNAVGNSIVAPFFAVALTVAYYRLADGAGAASDVRTAAV
jgi:hypothetical protein